MASWHHNNKSISADIMYEVTSCFINHLVSFDQTNEFFSFSYIDMMCHMAMLYYIKDFPMKNAKKKPIN